MKKLELIKELYEGSNEKIIVTDQHLFSLWKSQSYLPDVIAPNLLGKIHNKPISLPIKENHIFKYTDIYTVKMSPIFEDSEISGYILTFFDSQEVESIFCKSIHYQYRRKMFGNERMALMPILNEVDEYYAKGQDIPKEFFLNAKKHIAKLLSHNINCSQISRYYNEEIYTNLISITQILENTAKRFKDNFPDEQLDFYYELEHGLFAKMDSSCLSVAVLNLLINGYMYNDSKEKRLFLKAYKNNGKINIDIWDNGKSADTKKMEKNKIPFSYIDYSVDGESLGLSLAYKFATYYEGKLIIKKNEGGLMVRLSFPDKNEVPTDFKTKPSPFPTSAYFDTITCIMAKAE